MASPPRQRRARPGAAAGVTPASFTSPYCIPLIAETATNQATLGVELPPPHTNGTMAITRSNRQLWYWNGIWMKCAI